MDLRMVDSATSSKTAAGPSDADAQAFVESQFREHSAALEGFVRSRIRDPDLARDIVNDVFVRVLRLPEPMRIAVNPRAFLFTTAVNLIKDARRRAAVRARSAEQAADFAGAVRPVQPDDALESAETMRRLGAAFATLDQRRRRAFVMSRIENRSYGDIARELDVSLRTVERYIGEVLVRLRQELEE
jgi:RNA polymerase sigma-19 factor, ECF subfamily